MPKPEISRATISLKTSGNSTFWIYSEYTNTDCSVEISFDGNLAWEGPVIDSLFNLHRVSVSCQLSQSQIDKLLQDIEPDGNLADVSITVTNKNNEISEEIEEEVIIDGP